MNCEDQSTNSGLRHIMCETFITGGGQVQWKQMTNGYYRLGWVKKVCDAWEGGQWPMNHKLLNWLNLSFACFFSKVPWITEYIGSWNDRILFTTTNGFFLMKFWHIYSLIGVSFQTTWIHVCHIFNHSFYFYSATFPFKITYLLVNYHVLQYTSLFALVSYIQITKKLFRFLSFE